MRLLSQGPELNEEQREQEAQWGPPRGDPTQWASCLRVVDPSTLETASVLELDNNEAALSMCCVRFTGGEDVMLAVGTVQNLASTLEQQTVCLLHHATSYGIIAYVWFTFIAPQLLNNRLLHRVVADNCTLVLWVVHGHTNCYPCQSLSLCEMICDLHR